MSAKLASAALPMPLQPQAGSAWLQRASETLAELAARLRLAFERRATRMALLDLEPAQLADIGIDPLAGAAARPVLVIERGLMQRLMALR